MSSSSESKTYIYFGGGLIVFLLLILLVVWIISLTKGSYTTYEKVIDKMEKATIKYYEKNAKPVETGEHYLAYNTLVEANYIKPLNELLKNGDSCNAHVIVINNNGYYSYTPYLNCSGDNGYETIELSKVLTDQNNIVTSGSGLYKDEFTNTYYYRGEITNNYIKLGTVKRDNKEVDNLWRIVSIEEDGTIKIRNTNSTNSSYVWDDRYNIDRADNYGYNDFELSRMKDTLIYLGNRDSVMSEKYRNKLVPKQLCIAKRSEDDSTKDGSTECSILSQNSFVVGTITPYEYMRASLDNNCKRTVSNSCANYNYLSSSQQREWLITASDTNNYHVYSNENGSVLVSSAAYVEKFLYLTAYLSDKSFYVQGNGTISDPYIIR